MKKIIKILYILCALALPTHIFAKKCCKKEQKKRTDCLYIRPHHVYQSNYFGQRFPGYYDPFWYSWPGYYEHGYPYYGRGGVGFGFAVGV
ncbi:MAG: hypothetical protein WC707_02490 [Candidatus Babeliaceae bacterium]